MSTKYIIHQYYKRNKQINTPTLCRVTIIVVIIFEYCIPSYLFFFRFFKTPRDCNIIIILCFRESRADNILKHQNISMQFEY